jgi:hypothetical protein
VDFCEQIAKKFKIKIKPFKYYLLPNTDELGKIYNFDYWTYYIGGQTNLPLRELFTTYRNTNYPHELVHMMFPLKEASLDFTPKIISEGLATWLGGPKYNISFNQALKDVSTTLKKIKNPTYDDIKSSQIRNKFDSNILYITGAVLCKLAYEKKGSNAIWALYNSDEKSLDSVLERIFKQPLKNIKMNTVQYILDQTE